MKTNGMGTSIVRLCLASLSRTLLLPRAAFRANEKAFVKSRICLPGTFAAMLALSALFSLVYPHGAFAQAVAGLGAVAGTVRDASGAAVPNATVVVSNDSKSIRR